jgi:hypothetical protein
MRRISSRLQVSAWSLIFFLAFNGDVAYSGCVDWRELMMSSEKKRARDRERMRRKRAATDKEISDLRYLVGILLDNDPNEQIADNGMTVLDSWRAMAAEVLSEKGAE